jgi:anti-sigma regulatory factor (Ser/Thr protein kinase)
MPEDLPPHAVEPRPNAEIRLVLEPTAKYLSIGRRVISTIARGCRHDDCEIVLLVASELMANAVQHAAQLVELRVEFHDKYTRIDVFDDGDGWPRLRHVDPLSDTGGRGLSIVDRLSTAWGVEDLIPGKQVWSVITAGDELPAWLVAV